MSELRLLEFYYSCILEEKCGNTQRGIITLSDNIAGIEIYFLYRKGLNKLSLKCSSVMTFFFFKILPVFFSVDGSPRGNSHLVADVFKYTLIKIG